MGHHHDHNNALSRRAFMNALLAAGAGVAAAGWGAACSPKSAGAPKSERPGEGKTPVPDSPSGGRMPVGFVGHGAPTLAIDPGKGGDLARWSRALPKPRAILALSAHWEDAPASAGTTRVQDLMYDFYGFPEELYQIEYPSPGAPDLVRRIGALMGEEVTRHDRALDHGVWVPLLHMAPQADVPVLQLSLPSREGPEALFELGRKLAPLRDEGVFILGSGNVVHNLRRLSWHDPDGTAPPAWASEFDGWVREVINQGDFDALVDYRHKSPGLRIAHPTEEHFQPLLVAAGAASVRRDPVSYPVEGFEYGSISRRCVQFG